MANFSIALLQLLAAENDQRANLEKGLQYCRMAAERGADLALFPEMWNIGYSGYDDSVWESSYDPRDNSLEEKKQTWQRQAIAAEGEFVQAFRKAAQELNMAIAITFLEKWTGQPRNSLSIIDRHGQIVLTYAKVHTCDFSLEYACTPGDGFYVCSLDTAAGPVEIGAMICFDREFPESARTLMLKGAEIIITPNACDLEANRIGQFKARAFENMVGVAMANYASPQENGHSVAFDPRAFDSEGQSRETLIVEAGEEEGLFMANFDLEAIRSYREREVWGNAFRKTAAYKQLTSRQVARPFIRDCAR